jgi:predicted metalloprotease with PDZ domain
VILIDVRLFGAKTHTLKKVDQEILDFGIDRESFEEGVVRGLKEGSRAEQAGLKEGDRIVKSSYPWRCVDHFEEEMSVVVERHGLETEIKYWPRSFAIAKSWQMVKVDEE